MTVTATNGTVLYSNPMTSEETLAEYKSAALDASVCLDGAKRDRLVWAGDFYHTEKVLAASTARADFVLGTIDFVFSWQRHSEPFKGLVPISASLGTRPEYAGAFVSNYAALVDYQDLFASSIGNYFWRSGDVAGLGKYWPNIKELVAARLAYIDKQTGLVAGLDGAEVAYFLGPANGATVSALLAYTLRSLVPLADALNDTATSALYTSTAETLSQSINEKLWNETLGTYSLSIDAPSNYSLSSMAWTILSGTANNSQAESMINKLPDLRLGVGYKTSSSDADSGTTQLSPNLLGMLLEALFKAKRDLGVRTTTVAQTLLDDFWSKMVDQNEYYSGAAWEYLYPDGSPGIDLYTSLSHPWGAAPTYVMPEYVLGILATSPGYQTWRFEPPFGILGLTEANGTVVTPNGPIKASWKIDTDGESAVVEVNVPEGSTGHLILPESAKCEGHKGSKPIELGNGQTQQYRVRGWH